MSTDPVADVYTLSPLQQGLLFHTLYSPRTGVYFYQNVYALRGGLRGELFEQAWQRAVDRHTVLRTSFQWEDLDRPVQVVHREVRLPVYRDDWRGLPSGEQEERLRAFLDEDRTRGFALGEPPLMRLALFRVGADEHRLVWSRHHLLLDGWSVPLVLKEVLAGYEALLRGEEPSLPHPRPYRDYINWLRQQDLAAAEAFWRRELKGFTSPTRLGVERPTGHRTVRQAALYQEQRFRLPAELTAALNALARQHRLTLNTLLQGAWALLLSRYSGKDDVVFGTTVAGRSAALAGIESMVGLFINTLPVRVHIPPQESLVPWLQGLQAKQAELRQYEYSPLVQVQKWSEVPRISPLFDSLIVVENFPAGHASRQQFGNLEVRGLSRWGQSTYPLTLVAAPKRELSVRLTYEKSRYADDTVTRLQSHWQALLEGMAADPGRRLADLPLLTAAEQHRFREDATPKAHYPRGQCLHQWFEAQAGRTPDAVAVSAAGQSLSYAGLNRRANRLAHHLRGLGVGPEALVAVCLERSAELVVALLGILKAGGAYLPLDPAYPAERLAFVLADSGAPVLVTQGDLARRLPPHQARVLRLDADAAVLALQGTDDPASGATPDSLAYVIYTSGSTGRPKGVEVTHYNVARLFQATEDWFHFDHRDVWTLFHSYAFDFSVWELWGALLYGGRLVVVPYAVSRSPEEFYALLRSEGVTVLNQTPSAFRGLSGVEDRHGAADDLRLRLVIFGGEALELAGLRPWLERHGDRRPRLVNMYGITETTVHVTYRPIALRDLSEAPGSVIGGPIPDLKVYVLDGHGRPVPVGVAGELYVGGAGLARGYLNRPELTAERFVADPFAPGQRLYKSGDLARRLADGDLQYLGRGDGQVKVRGFRVELGEIEAALARHPNVRQAVVVVQVNDPRSRSAEAAGRANGALTTDKQLVAYLVADPKAVPSTTALREYLKERLPEYMVPAAFVALDALPLTANGKVDRRALPAPDRDRADLETPYVAPRTGLEHLLAGLWREVLKVERVGVDDNFFELGGNSILGVTAVGKLQEKLGEIIQVVTLFDAPTVAGLAEHLRGRYRESVARLFPGEPLPTAGAPAGQSERVGPAQIALFRQLIGEKAPPNGDGRAGARNRPAVFVLAPPRSGTTLLRVLLGGHPQLFAPPELELLAFATLPERKAAFSGRDSFWLEGTLRALMGIHRCDAAEAQRLMADYEGRGWTTRQFYRQLQDWLGERWLVDKTPSYALDPDVLRRMEDDFEGSRYLHLLRHPSAVVRSFEEARLEQLFFRRPHSFAPRQLAELVWTVSHQNVADFLRRVPAERQLPVRFEELVREPEPVLRAICAFLGLDFHPAMLRPHEDRKGRMTDGIHPESRMLGDVKFHEHQGIDAAAADRWKESGAADDLGDVTWQTAEALGYEPPAAGQRRGVSPPEDVPAPAVEPRFRSVLVRLHGHGARLPFFCVHPLGGSVFPFGLLALHVGADQPFYGLQARGLYNNEEPHTRLEDMAAHYVEAMRGLQPEGPYQVGGWSLGGIVALEIAQQLHAQGQDVGLLAILDAPIFSVLFLPPEQRRVRPEDSTAEKGLARMAARRGLSMNHLLQYPRADQEQLMLENATRGNLVGPDITLAQFRRWQEIVASNHQALMGYQVRPYPGAVTLFRATGNDLGRLPDWGPDLRWESVAGRLEVEVIPGDHKGILREPNVRVLAERLRARLDQVPAAQGVRR